MKEIRSNVSSFFLMAGRFQEVKRHAGHAIEEEGRDGRVNLSFHFFHWHDGWHHNSLYNRMLIKYDANLVMLKEMTKKGGGNLSSSSVRRSHGFGSDPTFAQ